MMANDVTVTVGDERLEELADACEAYALGEHPVAKDPKLRAKDDWVDTANALRELQRRRAGDAETETLRRERAEARECRFCRGTGRWPGSTDKCDRCGGSGKAPAPVDAPPQFFEIPPIDLTGGQDAADYVGEQRGWEDKAEEPAPGWDEEMSDVQAWKPGDEATEAVLGKVVVVKVDEAGPWVLQMGNLYHVSPDSLRPLAPAPEPGVDGDE